MLALAGCGTTRSTDTARTATEQLLISDAIDRAVQEIDVKPLSGQTVYLDSSMLKDVTDRNYLVSTIRQHLLANGCTLRDNRNEADFVVEARAGAVGTDRNDLLFGIPATNVPQILPLQGVPAAIPEVPLAKRRDQRGIAKISMFAYHRESGLPVWQSGLAVRESSSNDVWVFGAGPFEHGTVHKTTLLAARGRGKQKSHGDGKQVAITQEMIFASPSKLVEKLQRSAEPGEVARVTHSATATAEETTPVDQQANAAPSSPVIDRVLRTEDANELVKSAASEEKEPRLTGRIYDVQQLHSYHTKTVNSTPTEAPASDLVPLPTPRFDSM